MLSFQLSILLESMKNMAGFNQLSLSFDYLFPLCHKLACFRAINIEDNHRASEFLFCIYQQFPIEGISSIVKLFVELKSKLNLGAIISHERYQFIVQFRQLRYRPKYNTSKKITMEKNKIISRSIVIDKVAEKIDRERYQRHKASLDNISRSLNKYYLVASKEKFDNYHSQVEKLKKSKSYVKQLFDNKSAENEALVKKMIDIDRRKNLYQPSNQMFPNITNIHKKDKQHIKKENQMLVERILHERVVKSRYKIIQESQVYEKYKENLRKIKGTTQNRLQIIR